MCVANIIIGARNGGMVIKIPGELEEEIKEI